MAFFTYLLCYRRNGALYAGHTDDLASRIEQHRGRTFDGFTKRHGIDQLLWFEPHETRNAAFRRERQIEEWRRAWKIRLIKEANPDWRDLTSALPDLLSPHS